MKILKKTNQSSVHDLKYANIIKMFRKIYIFESTMNEEQLD
jgi:hypothetical protein